MAKKHEIRIPKLETMEGNPKSEGSKRFETFRHWDFEFVSYFVLRISDQIKRRSL